MNNLPIMSVSGIRGKVDETLTPLLVATIAFIQTKQCNGGPMVVGRDTRDSGPSLAAAAFRGIRMAGGTPIDIGIAPTPTTCFAVKHFGAAGGIIITASHNPLPYNGYKMVHRSGRLFNAAECDRIYSQFNTEPRPTWEQFCTFPNVPASKRDGIHGHLQAILAVIDIEAIRSANMKIAVDAINGAAGIIFPMLLDKLGVTWRGINIALDGNFVHNPEPRPENLTQLAALLRSEPDFRGGFAFDPDADRLAPMGENGEAISEEMTLALAVQSVLAKTPSTIATNLSTSMVIDDVARSFGAKVIRTKIGEANVVEALLRENCRIGGEGNGGVIYPQIATVRDGLTAIALILELMAKTGKTMTSLCSAWPVYQIVKEKISITGRDPSKLLAGLATTFQHETIDTQDGVKIIRDYGWVHLRPSNTEPILRLYAEACTMAQARELSAMIMEKIG
jgi:phosphomannomutase